MALIGVKNLPLLAGRSGRNVGGLVGRDGLFLDIQLFDFARQRVAAVTQK